MSSAPGKDIFDLLDEHGRALWDAVAADLQIPGNAAGLFPIAENITLLKPKLEILSKGLSEDFSRIFEWAEYVQNIPEDAEVRKRALYTYRRESDGGFRAPLHRNYGTSPVWCALWFRHSLDLYERPEPHIHQWLQAHLLTAFVHVNRLQLQRCIKGKWAPPKWDNAALGVREAHRVSSCWLLQIIAPGIEDPQHLIANLDRLKAELSPGNVEGFARLSLGSNHPGRSLDAERESIKQLANNLALAHDLLVEANPDEEQPKKKVRGKSGGTRKTEQRILPDHAFYRVLDSNYPGLRVLESGIETLQYQTPEKSTAHELVNSGIDGGEFDSLSGLALDVGHTLGEEDEGIRSFGPLPPLSTLFAIARSKARHVSVHAQRLTVERSRIRLKEIQTLVSTLERLYRETTSESRRLTIELAAVSLVTGSPFSAVRRLKLCKSIHELGLFFTLALNPVHFVWIRSNDLMLERNPMVQSSVGQQYHGTRPRVVFQDVWGIASKIDPVSSEPFAGHWEVASRQVV